MEEYVVRYGNEESVLGRSDYDTLKNCEKFISKLTNNSDVTWFELLYEPLDEDDAQYIVRRGEKDLIDLFGNKVVVNVWKMEELL